MLLSDKYPFLANYFTKLIESEDKAFPHSILLYGNDINAQYNFAKEIARILNCEKEKKTNCNCYNCKLINENIHPAVITVSRLDYKPADDDSKTVISMKQSAAIKESLINSSDFHRVFIFCDRDDTGILGGLNQINFQAETANSLLKIIEEPQPNITFIFLTRDQNDLLSTIKSRSQSFFIPSYAEPNYSYSAIENIFTNYWEYDRKEVFDISQSLQDLSKEIPTLEILEQIQNYILNILKSNPRQVFLIKHIEIIEESKKQAKLGIKPAGIFDDLCLKLIN